MPHPLGIPSIPFPEKQTAWPWGNSPEFFYELCQDINSPEEATKKFQNFLMNILWGDKTSDLIFINSFLKTLWYNSYIHHNNGDPEKIWDELNTFVEKLEEDEYREEFIEKVQKRIVEKVADGYSENLWNILADFKSRDIDLDEIMNAVSCMDIGPKETNTFATKVFRRKAWGK